MTSPKSFRQSISHVWKVTYWILARLFSALRLRKREFQTTEKRCLCKAFRLKCVLTFSVSKLSISRKDLDEFTKSHTRRLRGIVDQRLRNMYVFENVESSFFCITNFNWSIFLFAVIKWRVIFVAKFYHCIEFQLFTWWIMERIQKYDMIVWNSEWFYKMFFVL